MTHRALNNPLARWLMTAPPANTIAFHHQLALPLSAATFICTSSARYLARTTTSVAFSSNPTRGENLAHFMGKRE